MCQLTTPVPTYEPVWNWKLKLVLLLCALSVHSSGLSASESTRSSAKGGSAKLDIRMRDGTALSVPISMDATVSANAAPKSVKVIGEIKRAAIVVVDTYPSKPGGMSLCQAGEEQFVRVLTLKPPRETAHIKLASCRDNLELASPGLAWIAESQVLKIDWLMGPAKSGKPETRTIRIDANGRVK
jgi:hypothetical protein